MLRVRAWGERTGRRTVGMDRRSPPPYGTCPEQLTIAKPPLERPVLMTVPSALIVQVRPPLSPLFWAEKETNAP